MLKIELHSHTADDPVDRIRHSSEELIDRAAELGYDALAITLHDRQLSDARLTAYARERGILLIPGVERTIDGRHVLMLNFSPAAADVRSFDEVAELKRREAGIVIAPHPFFPTGSCLGSLLERHAELFDAVEWNAMFMRGLNFNRRAERWAAAHGKPMVGNCDVHRLYQMGTCYSLVDAECTAAAICDAIKNGRVEVVAEPLSPLRAAWTMTDMTAAQVMGIVQKAAASRGLLPIFDSNS